MQLSSARRYQKGDLVLARGDDGNGLFGIESGRVRSSAVSSDGNEMSLMIFGAGSWFGVINAFDAGPSPFDCHAIEPTCINVVPRCKIHRLLQESAHYYLPLVLHICQSWRLTVDLLQDHWMLPLQLRLAKRLLTLARLFGLRTPTGTLIDLHLPQDELGRMLGVTRQTINKEMGKLRALRLILSAPSEQLSFDLPRLDAYVRRHVPHFQEELLFDPHS